MAASVPVVATRVGGIPEIVVDGETGLLVPAPPTPPAVAEAVARLLGDPALRRALGSRGRERFLRDFSAPVWMRRTRAVYEDVVTGGACAASAASSIAER
jgi:glycosyltransferase involved in cell wall biosynthesis